MFGVKSSNYTDAGLKSNNTYYSVTTAVDQSANESSYSAEASGRSNRPAPAAPAGLVVWIDGYPARAARNHILRPVNFSEHCLNAPETIAGEGSNFQ